jgi:apolipoprotein N-acyltransferase
MSKNFIGKILSHKYSFLLPPLISGIILIAAFPPFEQGYLAWFALLPLLGTCLKVKPTRAFWAGLVFGLPLNLYLNLYLARVLFPYLSFPLALTAMAGLVIYISFFYALFALGASLASRMGKPWFTALAVPSIWLLSEYLRSIGFMAYNVGYLGYSQWAYPGLLNLAAFYGYWGLPFLMVFFQAILLLLWRKELAGLKLSAIAAVFLLLLTAGLIGPTFETVTGDNGQLKVSLIQGNSKPEEVIGSGKTEIMHRYLALTRQAVKAEPAVDLVVWPETVVDLDFRTGKNHHPAMIETAEELEVSLLYGARVRYNGKTFNSITLITEAQSEMTLYNKHRLVPFVEYFPLEGFLNRLLKLELLLGSYTVGEKTVIFQINGIPLAGVICFESYFGDHTRLFAAEGIDHLFVLTNDAWFGESIGLEQHAQAAAIRAAEMGLGVTQVANSGITISFDYRGRELFRTGKNETALINTAVDLTKRNTVYVRYGDYFPAFWALFLIITIPILLLQNATLKNP